MSGPLLLAPLRLEALALRRGAPTLEVERIGMGPIRATAARARLSARELDGRPIVLAGVAGGLVAHLRPGEVVVATSIGSTESDENVSLASAVQLSRHLESNGINTHLAPIVCAPRILHGDEQREKAASSGAVAVEMEALWLTPLVGRHPFGVVRVILDTVGEELGSPATPRALRVAYRALRECGRALASITADLLSAADKEH